MPTYGSSPSWANYYFYEVNVENQAAQFGNMPDNGWITSISFYANSEPGYSPTNFYGCLWNSSGTLIANSGAASVGAGSNSVGGQSWITTNISGIFLSKGTGLYIGWSRDDGSGHSMLYSVGGSGNHGYIAKGGAPGNLGTLEAIPNRAQIGAYVTYTTVYQPQATTNAANPVGSTTATLNGTVNPEGLQTTYYFQWGTTTSYGNQTASQQTGTNGSSFSNVGVSAALTGLTSGVTYHYRLVATNGVNTVYGADQQFTTSGTPSAPTLNTPANNTYESDWQSGTTFSWTYNPVSGSGETGYYLKVTPSGAAAQWWTGSAWSTTEAEVVTSSTSVTISAANMQTLLGNPGTVQTYTWTVASQDNIGKGAYATANTVNDEIPPAAPTLTSPANATYEELATTPTFAWTYNPTNAQGGQTAYAFRRKVSGGSSYSYWNAGSSSWQSTIIWNSYTSQSLTFPSAAWTDGSTYNWSVATQDAGGQGPFASDRTVTAQAAPTVTVSAPTGTEAAATPVVAWSATFPTGVNQTAYQVRTFSQAQYSAQGFNPATSTAVDDSGVVAGTATSYQLATGLQLDPATIYRSYVNLTETGSETNGFNAYTQYTASADTPNAPTITATPTTDPGTGCPMVQLQVQCEVNLLSAVDSSFESGVGSFVANSNTAIAQSSAQALDGSFSLSMTSSAAGNIGATSGHTYAVTGSTQYTALASFRTAVSARSCLVQIDWYTSGGALISSSTGTTVSDSSTGWTQATVTATSPSNAAFADVQMIVQSTAAASEVHYADQVGLFPGSSTTWSLGGFLTTAGVVILRSDGVYVRNASTANPALLSNAPASQLVTVNDYEATALEAYTYTAQIQATGGSGQVVSPSSAPAAASLSFVGFWEIDPTSPSSAINAQPLTWNPQQYEQGAAQMALGQTTQVYVAYAMQNQDFTATFEIFYPAIWSGLMALVQSQKTVFINAPYGFSGYYRLAPAPGGLSAGTGSKAQDAQLLPSAASAPHYTLALTGIAQPRPPV